jgi:hypothetical protein
MHRNKAKLLAAAALACGLVGLAVPFGGAQTYPDPIKPLPKRTAEEWRKLYPFQSVEDRLAYEAGKKAAVAPALSPDAAKRLANSDRVYQPGRNFGDIRRESLKKLHSAEVEDFIKRDGFGLERMPRPSPRYLELAQAPTFPVGRVSYPDSALENDPHTALPARGAAFAGESRLPTLETMVALHWQSEYNFASPASLGYVRKPKEVSGFDPHKFHHEPFLGDKRLVNHDLDKEGGDQNKERWALRRLELVSLVRHERPVAYVSAQLPRMEDLKNAPTRELDAFEAAALKRLEAGEEVVTDASLNRIRMAGAVRASKACLDCHSAQHGQLLGVFSYDLWRDPPLKK